MPSKQPGVRAALYAMLLVWIGLIVSCGGGSTEGEPKIKVEVTPSVTADTQVRTGTVKTAPRDEKGRWEASLTVHLDIPDGSKVLQFKAPKVDFVFICAHSEHRVTGTTCILLATEGGRGFWFEHRLTTEQEQTLKKVVIQRLYE